MTVHTSSIPGVLLFNLDVHGDARGSFCEVMQLEKMCELGLPADFTPVQTNLSKSQRNVIRGIHAEPWHKLITVPLGSVFAAIVDLRPDSSAFGSVETFDLDEHTALFVPKACGNSFAVTSDEVFYLYNVTDHWKPGLKYPEIAYNDPDLAIDWPIAAEDRILSEKDQRNQSFADYKSSLTA